MVFTAVQNDLPGMSQIIPWYQEKAEINVRSFVGVNFQVTV